MNNEEVVYEEVPLYWQEPMNCPPKAEHEKMQSPLTDTMLGDASSEGESIVANTFLSSRKSPVRSDSTK